MLFGKPERLAFLIEKVPEWSNEYFKNGLLYVIIKWEMYPNEVRNTTLSVDLPTLFGHEGYPSGMNHLVNDEKLYALPDEELFAELRHLRYYAHFTDDESVHEDYRFDLNLWELGDCGYRLFAVSNGENVRILVGHWIDWDGEELESSFVLVNSVEITLEEFTKIRDELSERYEKEINR